MNAYTDRLLKLIVMSDIHLLPEGEVKRGLDTGPRFEAALDSVQALHMDADLCVFAGDITEKSDVQAYERFDHMRSRIELPQRVLMGNHDDRNIYLTCASEPMLDENGFIEGFEDIKGHRILMLDSSEPGMTRGGLCRKRLTWVADRLAEAKAAGLKVIILLHHNPCALQMPVDTYRLAEPDKLLAVLHRSDADIIQIVAGHCHITTAGSWGGYPCATISGNQHRVEPFLRGRSGQQACYEGPAQYAVIQSDGTNCAVHYQNYVDHSTVMNPELFPGKMKQEFESLDY
ncbi:3',5'-cyclic adenosine monophosphate phosphodiesterase CpdA [Pseudovibrio axinellae]|uniref:3',5'-cyclic adenosine monophosphate phosphodiesterase CpdA n=1 Tax=Pseudovibrio axinellae TaxID=989403 RepID=A0A161UGI1_9HYPH|nr:metallophosphoesterase [Pseudovibrio axinellae]KZL04623.1 3',5'-cyclic adenosine monophosphate phosphodiesterase CpdA [Pseudovibrio axinellae]SEQ70976.1 Calcineurin-like phosphoesterase [Pseudovibrio axinellae]